MIWKIIIKKRQQDIFCVFFKCNRFYIREKHGAHTLCQHTQHVLSSVWFIIINNNNGRQQRRGGKLETKKKTLAGHNTIISLILKEI